ncbi:NUDIX domain-containing protein [Alkaliphilus peptidifermentans]|uniref:ADP-ribose pyrophosphatase YjhB, NUDIX family n=1 Tax=Alkaliphilus peptidifermentans DSM 18978 TaxID=1120976 RepID=A0A1G5CL68_9FIRM|nr:NUDIX hydrolase [Alkaliphilus peptidifermentans]SCY03289.1 ADP-ribose pyrophosphatase YjhB, NUDIX family [Alkaliphilus peptidifermentans DSM 18978]
MKNSNFIGVGGLLYYNNGYLLVRHSYGEYNNMWIIPGGHVNSGEHLHKAVEREVYEETGVSTTATNIVAVRSRQRSTKSLDCYIVFLLTYNCGNPTSDGFENSAVEFFTYKEVVRMENIIPLTKILIQQHHESKLNNLQKVTSQEPYTNDNSKLTLYL